MDGSSCMESSEAYKSIFKKSPIYSPYEPPIAASCLFSTSSSALISLMAICSSATIGARFCRRLILLKMESGSIPLGIAFLAWPRPRRLDPHCSCSAVGVRSWSSLSSCCSPTLSLLTPFWLRFDRESWWSSFYLFDLSFHLAPLFAPCPSASAPSWSNSSWFSYSDYPCFLVDPFFSFVLDFAFLFYSSFKVILEQETRLLKVANQNQNLLGLSFSSSGPSYLVLSSSLVY